jgi:hypothetical protein
MHPQINVIPAEIAIRRKYGRPIGSKDKHPQKKQNKAIDINP